MNIYKKMFSVLIFIVILSIPLVCNGTDKNLCEGLQSSLVISTSDHKMFTCQNSQKMKEYRIALGSGGVDKKTQGDKKTPLGKYLLGTPRSSNKFGIFIPIGYPTQEQQSEGFSGKDVGVHGPYRLFKWFGRINTLFDWTQGCIAVGSDVEISEIAQWIKDQNVTEVLLK